MEERKRVGGVKVVIESVRFLFIARFVSGRLQEEQGWS